MPNDKEVFSRQVSLLILADSVYHNLEASVPLSVLQQQMRHADVRTTLAIYAHVLPESQRAAVESIAIGTTVPIGTRNSANSFSQ